MVINVDSNNSTITVNLTSLIPYQLKIDKGLLLLSKGIMRGSVQLEAIILELKQQLGIPLEQIKVELVNDEPLIKISSVDVFDQKAIEDLIIEIISRELPHNLQNFDTKKSLIYITEELVGIPLIGSFYIGIIDRGTNLLQVRANTGCPLNCPFCSVDEGPASNSKLRDFIVDPDYLISSYRFVLKEKNLSDAEAHLDGQGEPMSYPYLVEVIQELSDIKETKIISIQTNGWYLTEKLIDDLEAAGLTRINLSLNTLQLSEAKRLSGRGDYPLNEILEMAKYIADSKIELLLAPLWIPNINDEAIQEIIKFAKETITKKQQYPILGIQNYLTHFEGRNIKGIKRMKFSEFNVRLRELSIKYGIPNLVLKPYMFDTHKTKMIANPLKINEKTLAKVILPGRIQNEVLAVAKNRLIHVSNVPEYTIGKSVTVQITRNRHNIFFGKLT